LAIREEDSPQRHREHGVGFQLVNAGARDALSAVNFQLGGVFGCRRQSRRCLIPADGFYEWHAEGKRKQPYLFRRVDEKPMAFAGLWEKWNDIETCTIITIGPNAVMDPVHDRMPVILAPNDYQAWFDAAPDDALKVLTPCPPDELIAYPVNPIVNNARNEVPECIEPMSS
jgi:putative SOS response-associated peptidase YedK